MQMNSQETATCAPLCRRQMSDPPPFQNREEKSPQLLLFTLQMQILAGFFYKRQPCRQLGHVSEFGDKHTPVGSQCFCV